MNPKPRALSAPELILRTLVENTGSVVYLFRMVPFAELEYISPGIETITGYSPNDFYADKTLLHRLVHDDDRLETTDLIQSIVDNPGKEMVLRLWRKDAAMVWIEYLNIPMFDKKGNLIGIQGKARDITPEKRLYGRDNLIKEVALMVVEDKPLRIILSYICDRLANIYGLNMAWIGMKEPDGRVSIGAAAGTPHPLPRLYELVVRWDEGHGAAGKVIRSGKTLIVDLERDIFQPWYDRLAARNIHAVASFPLKTKGLTLGAFVLYSTHEAFFSVRVVSEIEDLCDQMALVIHDAITKQQLLLITTGLQSATSAVIITDYNFLINWNNTAFTRMSHYSGPEMKDRHFNELVTSPTLNSAFYASMRETVLAGSTWKQEIDLPLKNKGAIPVEMVVTPVKDEKGVILHFVIVLHDLTERKQAETALQCYQLIYEQAKDIILIVRPDGRIIDANPSAVKAYGFPRKKLLSMSVNSAFEPVATSACSGNLLRHEEKAGKSWMLLEAQHHRKDGSAFPVEVSSVSTYIDYEQVIFGIIRDITDRKQAELHKLQVKETIAQAEKLASLGRMAAGISHEINQPLNSIKVITDSIRYWHRKGITTETPDLINAISNISSQADRIDKVIKHVRAFLHGNKTSQLVPSNINSAIESALNLFQTQLQASNIRLSKNLADGLPAVLATPTGLEEIIINLVANAVNALGKIDRKNRILSITTTFADSILIEVADNGPGIADKIKHQIFEPFFTTDDSSSGMGLGLSIIHSIIASYGGQIGFVNNDEGGATFWIKLPIYKENTGEEK